MIPNFAIAQNLGYPAKPVKFLSNLTERPLASLEADFSTRFVQKKSGIRRIIAAIVMVAFTATSVPCLEKRDSPHRGQSLFSQLAPGSRFSVLAQRKELRYGLIGGSLSRRDRPLCESLYGILRGNGVADKTADRLAQTIARMKGGSLEIICIAGVITEKEKGIFVRKDEVALEAISDAEKRDLAERLNKLAESYERGLADRDRRSLMKRLIPLEVVENLAKENKASKDNILSIIDSHPDFPIWILKAKLKVEEIKDKVGGVRNAWVIVKNQNIDKVDQWVEKAKAKVDAIKEKVGGTSNAWLIVIGFGLDKADAWIKEAGDKVDQIKDRVGGTSNAWDIVRGQGLRMVDAWLVEAEEKVKTIERRVTGNGIAWDIVVDQGLNNVDNWIARAEPAVKGLVESGYSNKMAWYNVVHNGIEGSLLLAAVSGKIEAQAVVREAMLAPGSRFSRRALGLDEKTCRSLSSKIVEELNLSQVSDFPTYNDTEYIYGARHYVKEMWGAPIEYARWGVEPICKFYFIRIGNLFFIEETAYSRLSQPLREALGVNVIKVTDLDNNLGHPMEERFIVCTIIAMMNSDFLNKRTVDLGAGDGILSLVAMKLGASSVDLVEINSEKLAQADRQMRLNGFIKDQHYRLHNMDLKETARLADRLKLTKGETAVISNIGTWTDVYNVTNADSIALICEIPDVTLFVGGGYKEWLAQGFRLVWADQGLIKQLGFIVNPIIAKCEGRTAVLAAWTATRNPGDTRLDSAEALRISP